MQIRLLVLSARVNYDIEPSFIKEKTFFPHQFIVINEFNT